TAAAQEVEHWRAAGHRKSPEQFEGGSLEKCPKRELASGLPYGPHGFVAEAGGVIPSPTVTATAARERFLLTAKRYVRAAAAEAEALRL
ncbi:MAG TPA: hypothetical protein VGX03_07375, partial [Candidatus Binatia bacterium]|nr:hypothetical protein [Candidatus Binatia bacterium]